MELIAEKALEGIAELVNYLIVIGGVLAAGLFGCWFILWVFSWGSGNQGARKGR